MKCPHCGAQMLDEQIYCEKCGKERQLVPVFDAEVDEKLASTISVIADDLANTQEIVPLPLDSEQRAPEKEENQIKSEDEKSTSFFHISFALKILLLILGVVILVGAVAYGLYKNDEASYEFQLQKAEEFYEAEDYEQMLVYAQKAIDMAPNSSDAKMMMARAYEGLAQIQKEELILEELLKNDPAFASAYDLLIPIYIKNKEYDLIGTLLENCEVQTVLDKYADYLTDCPKFSQDGGLYEEIISVRLIAAGGGEIYYTLDGTLPDESGIRYITPIILDSGAYLLRCVYVNEYGISSEVAEQRFYIEAQVPGAPDISLASGTYTEPQMIVVDIPDEEYQVFYTTDGSEPGMESRQYTGPIPLPLGESQFAFVAYDDQDTPSDVSYMNYTLELEIELTTEQAKNILMQALISAGIIEDADGTIAAAEGTKQYSVISVIKENDVFYYLLEEKFVSSQSETQRTGNLYAVCIETGESFTAIQNTLGDYDLHKLF